MSRCPDCGVELLPFHAVQPSAEAQLERDALLEQVPREHRRLPFWSLRHKKGVLLACALLGLATYALPWFAQTSPETRVLTGYQLARHFVGWLWGGAIGWFILLPLVLTRRSIVELRGVRLISAVFASMTALEILVFVNMTASRQHHVLVQFAWEWGIWASCFVSAVGTCAAVMLGGPLPDPPTDENDPRGGLRGAKNKAKGQNPLLH